MMATIQDIPELYTDEIEDTGGGAFNVSFHMRVIFVGGDPAGEWHFYGTEPDPVQFPDAITHDATHFPFALTQTTEGLELLYDLAVSAERAALEA